MSEMALKLIKKCIKNKETELDLGRCGLTDRDFDKDAIININIRKCSHITTLILSNSWHSYPIRTEIESINQGPSNWLSKIPEVITTLSKLLVFRCGGTEKDSWVIDDISPTQQLSMLETLDVSNNSISKIRHPMPNLKKLYCNNNFLSSLAEISQFNQLQTLCLAENQIHQIDGLKSLINLCALDLSNNNINQIKGLSAQKSLEFLNLSNNYISKIEGLSTLRYLHDLSLGDNNIEEIEGLQYLTNLHKLDLRSNKIKKLKGLDYQKFLWYLDLNDNQITDVDTTNGLPELSWLDIGENNLVKPGALTQFTSLDTLYLEENELTSLDGIENLTSLKLLSIHTNILDDITPISCLTKLETLWLHENKIRDISTLSSLINLVELDVENNEISDISILASLSELQIVDLSCNLVEDISALLNLSKLKVAKLTDTPIEQKLPSAVVGAGWPAIRDRLLSESKEQFPLFKEVKVLLLGNTNVGKSNLLEYLETNKTPTGTASTHGIQYACLSNVLKETNIHIWDFGGQEYFHATHQLFFSADALNILLWSRQDEPRQSETFEACFELNYWLRCIEQLVPKDTNNPIEVIIAENKIDLNNLEQTLIDQVYYKSKLPHFNLQFVHFSLKTLKRMGHFQELLTERIEKLYTNQPYSYKEYLATIRRAATDVVTIKKIGQDIDKIKIAMKVFHNMGILLYFHEVIPDMVFIKPQALLNFLYQEVLGKERNEQIKMSLIEKAISGNKWDLSIDHVVGLLKHFDLVFEVPNYKDTLFVPQYLKDAPILIDLFEKYHFQQPNIIITSDHFLMSLAMLRVFSGYGAFVKRNDQRERLFWKDGIVIDKNGQLLMIKLNRVKQQIELFPDQQHHNFNLQNEVVQFILSTTNKHNKRHKSKNEDTIAHTQPLSPTGATRFTEDHPVTEPLSTELLLEAPVNTSDPGGQAMQPWRYRILPTDHLPQIAFNWDSQYFAIQVSLDGQFYVNWSDLVDHVNKGIFMLEAKFQKLNQESDTWETLKKTVSVFDYNKYLPKNQKGEMKKIFISYSKEDLAMVNKFRDHLASLKLDGKVADWYCSELKAGSEWHHEIQEHFEEADIICFMVSPNFMKTQYIHEYEIARAFELKKVKPQLKIVPIILDFCRWTTKHNNLGDFTALPYTAKPVMDFANQNMAWYIIEECLRLMIEKDLFEGGENVYINTALPKDIQNIMKRIVSGEANA